MISTAVFAALCLGATSQANVIPRQTVSNSHLTCAKSRANTEDDPGQR